jgi:hypothetical protein
LWLGNKYLSFFDPSPTLFLPQEELVSSEIQQQLLWNLKPLRRAERYLRQQQISNHNDWQLGRNNDYYSDPLPFISQYELEYFSAFFGGEVLDLLSYHGASRSTHCDDIYDIGIDVAAALPNFVSEHPPVSFLINAHVNVAPWSQSMEFAPHHPSLSCNANGSPNLAVPDATSNKPASTPTSTITSEASSPCDNSRSEANGSPCQNQLHEPLGPRAVLPQQPLFPCLLCPNRPPFKLLSLLK